MDRRWVLGSRSAGYSSVIPVATPLELPLADHAASAHPLRGTTMLLAACAALAAPFVLSADEFVALFVAGAFFGAVGSAFLWHVAHRGSGVTPAAVARWAGSSAAGAVVAVVGGCLVPAIDVSGAVVALAVVVSAPYLGRRIAARRRRATSHVPAAPELLTPPLHVCSTAEISAAWTASHEALRRSTSPADRSAITALRAAYLDELERRDASGLRRWLESGNALTSDPARFLGAGRDEPEPDAR